MLKLKLKEVTVILVVNGSNASSDQKLNKIQINFSSVASSGVAVVFEPSGDGEVVITTVQ